MCGSKSTIVTVRCRKRSDAAQPDISLAKKLLAGAEGKACRRACRNDCLFPAPTLTMRDRSRDRSDGKVVMVGAGYVACHRACLAEIVIRGLRRQ